MAHWKAKWFPMIVALFPVTFPLYLFKGTLMGVPLTLVELLLGVIVLLFIFTERIWEPKWWSRNWSHWKLWPIALFVLAAFISAFMVQGSLEWLDGNIFEAQMRALGILKGWILAPLIYFAIARHVFSERPSLVTVSLDALLCGGMVLAFLAIQQEASGEFLTADGRASGPFESANYLSLYLGPMVVYGLLQSVQEKVWDFRRTARLLLTIVVAIGLAFTESYASWIAVFGTIGLWSLLSFSSIDKKWRRIISGSLVAAVLIVIASQLGSDKFTQFFELAERSSSSVRLEVYEISLKLLTQHPIFGLGLGQFEWFYQTQAVELLGQEPFEWVMLHPHNIVFAMWLNMGIVGLIGFIWLCVKALAWLFEKDKKGRRVAAFMLVSILIHGLFDTPYFKNDLAFQFWLLMAILI